LNTSTRFTHWTVITKNVKSFLAYFAIFQRISGLICVFEVPFQVKWLLKLTKGRSCNNIKAVAKSQGFIVSFKELLGLHYTEKRKWLFFEETWHSFVLRVALLYPLCLQDIFNIKKLFITSLMETVLMIHWCKRTYVPSLNISPEFSLVTWNKIIINITGRFKIVMQADTLKIRDHFNETWKYKVHAYKKNFLWQNYFVVRRKFKENAKSLL